MNIMLVNYLTHVAYNTIFDVSDEAKLAQCVLRIAGTAEQFGPGNDHPVLLHHTTLELHARY